MTPVAGAWLTKTVIDESAGGGSAGTPVLLALMLGIGAVFLVGQLTQNGVVYLQTELVRRIEFLVQDRLFAKLNQLHGLQPFEQPEFHDRIELAQQAGQVAPRQMVEVAARVIQGVVSLLGFLAALFAVSPGVAALACVAAVPQLVAELRLAKQRVSLEVTISPTERRRFFYSRLQSEPQAAKELRLFGLGDFFRSRMLSELRTIHLAERRLDKRALRVQSMLDVGSTIVMTCALALAGWQVAQGIISPGGIAVFVVGLPAVASSVSTLTIAIGHASEALLMVGHYHALAEATPDPVRAKPERPAPPLREAIVFHDVWFRYADDLPWVLRGVTMEIPRGRSMGLVGLNGAGKSTIVKLLARLYEPSKGAITWDGIDLREIDPASLRRRMGAVFQDYMAYDMTASENIGIGDLALMDDPPAVEGAAEKAGIDGAIRRLPRGFRTMLSKLHFGGEDEQSGVQLSGGQWQRLALARMLMRADRDLLTLDEPSAGLDAEAEEHVHRTIHEQTAGTTRLLISHRLNAVRMADQIVVVDDGRIIERGSHDSLMRENGRYAELFRSQAAGYQDAPTPEPG
ncbi:ABC transporter ATP-binding protein [Nonomuraea sp. NPDC049695]|uniref:ABC transporter ATP-binding protein n=1 Tax=Nonomuraea sp. NPDC049695 TaxID=3154734 RepID=UPI00341922D0